MTVEISEGEKISVSFDGQRCIHARRCVTGEPSVFRANVEGPWIDADGATAEEILTVALNCPSGAITVRRKDGGADERAPKANKILVRENGPLAVNAEVIIDGHGEMLRATLCRCGLSQNKRSATIPISRVALRRRASRYRRIRRWRSPSLSVR